MRKKIFSNTIMARVALTVLAFVLMTVSSCFIMGRTLNNKLLKNADDVISGTQSHIYHLLLEPEAVINMIADSIQERIQSGDSPESIQAYLLETDTPVFRGKMRMFDYTGIYGYFNVFEVFYDGTGWIPPGGYVPQERPWYTEAERNGGLVAITNPYIDMDTGESVISFSRQIFGHAGESLGVVAIDVPLEYIGESINERKITEGSFGILVDETMQVIVHPDDTQIGISIIGSGLPVEQFSDLIQEGLPISRLTGFNYRGENSLFFGRQLNNGWYISIVVPQSEYYAELYQMILIISILGTLLAASLIFMLLRLEKAKRKSDEESRQKSAKLTEMEKQRAADELTQLMLDATPLAFSLWTSELKNIATNEETVRMFGLKSKEEYLERFHDFSPPYQPCGTPSAEKALQCVQKAFDEGYCRADWIHQSSSGEPIQAETTLVRVKRGDGYVVAGYTRDLREYKKMLGVIERRDELLQTVNQAANIMLTTGLCENIEGALMDAFQLIGRSMDVDRVQLWKNEMMDGELYFVNRYEWLSEVGKQMTPVPNGFDFTYSVMPEWHAFFLQGGCINAPLSSLKPDEQEFLKTYDMRSIVIIPLFMQDEFWGFFSIDDCRNERVFTEEDVDILSSASLMMACAVTRHEQNAEIREANENAQKMLIDLASAQQTTSAMFDNNPLMSILFDDNFQPIDCNPTALRLWNFPSKEALLEGFVEKIRQSIPPVQSNGKPSAAVHEHFTAALQEGYAHFENEVMIDGDLRVHSVEFRRIPYEGSYVIAGYTTDMTEIRAREKEIKTALEESKAIMDNLDSMIAVSDLDDNLLFINKTLADTYGIDRETCIGKKCHEVIRRCNKPCPSCNKDELMQTKDTFPSKDYEYVWDQYMNVWISGTDSIIRWVDGSTVFFQSMRDTTQKKEGEEALLRAHEDNKLQLSKLDMATKATKIAMWEYEIILDDPVAADNLFVYTDEFRELLGYTDETDFPNITSSWSNCVHPDDRERVLEAFSAHMVDWTGNTPYDIEYRVIKKNGEIAYHHCTGTTTRDENGKPLWVVGTQMDVTNAKNTLLETESLRAAAEAANQAKSDFLSSMSHEIRTPMNAIIGMSDLLALEQLNDRQSHYVMDISTSANSLLSIINNILDLSRVESGKLSLDPVDYDFYALMDNVKSMFKFVAEKKGIEFILKTEKDLPAYLFGDDVRLRQILTNVCGNAVKFTEKGYVMLSVTTDDGNLIFVIRDTGMGVRKEDLPRLFNAYEQVDKHKNRNLTGTGLGLTISRAFAEMMGGSITVDSDYGEGTTFTLVIPIVEGDKDKVKYDDADIIKKLTVRAPDARILVVDDNDVNLRVATGLLSLYEITPVTVLSGREALRLVRENEYDIIFMDHMMPEMDGVETTAAIRNLGSRYESMTIIALTANAIQGAREMFLANGFDGFLSKPIITNALHETLMEWLPAEKIIEKAGDDSTVPQGNTNGFLDALKQISEINTKAGLRNFNGVAAMYRETFELFYRKITKECDMMTAFLDASDADSFAILIHGMKSSLAIVGAVELSDVAAKMENAAQNGDVGYCLEQYPPFKKKMLSLHERLNPVFGEAKSASDKPQGDMATLRESVEKALEAADDFDSGACMEMVRGLLKFDFGEETNRLLEDALSALGDFNIGEAIRFLKRIA